MITSHDAILTTIRSARHVFTSTTENAISPPRYSLSVILLIMNPYFIGGREKDFPLFEFN